MASSSPQEWTHEQVSLWFRWKNYSYLLAFVDAKKMTGKELMELELNTPNKEVPYDTRRDLIQHRPGGPSANVILPLEQPTVCW